jgi:hypothetical protein
VVDSQQPQAHGCENLCTVLNALAAQTLRATRKTKHER